MTSVRPAWKPPTARERLALLQDARSIAIVGASANPARAANFVATYLVGSTSYDVWFVNPRETSIFGRPVYASLAALPSAPDVVDAFRQPDALPGLAEEAVAGDIVGIPNHGTLSVGDTLTEGAQIKVTGIPNFAPEIIRRVRLTDPIKAKQLSKALSDLAEEGVA